MHRLYVRSLYETNCLHTTLIVLFIGISSTPHNPWNMNVWKDPSLIDGNGDGDYWVSNVSSTTMLTNFQRRPVSCRGLSCRVHRTIKEFKALPRNLAVEFGRVETCFARRQYDHQVGICSELLTKLSAWSTMNRKVWSYFQAEDGKPATSLVFH